MVFVGSFELEFGPNGLGATVFTMPFVHDPSHYTTIPTRRVPGCLSLTRGLIHAAPDDPPPAVAIRLNKLYSKATALQFAWIEANLPGGPEGLRRFDLAVDRSWGVVRDRVEDWVEVDDPELGERASQLLAALFPNGLDFVNFGYHEEWAESERRIAWIEHEKLGPELDDLVDKRMMSKLYIAHKQYGDALEITAKAPQTAAKLKIRDCLQALRTELANYARLVIGLVDDDDQAAVDRAEAQLAPILKYRQHVTASVVGESVEQAVDDEEAEAIEAVLPEPPAVP